MAGKDGSAPGGRGQERTGSLMIEVLWHGRGGQGAFTAARLLGAAAMEAGLSALAFPSFGPERRGAPMRAFTKLGGAPIGDRSASRQADYVVYLDDTLLGEGWEAELKPGGRALVNSTRSFDDERVLALDADGLSAAVLGRPIPNTALLGALARLEPAVTLDHIGVAVRSSMAPRLHEPNCAVAAQAYEATDALLAEGGSAAGQGAGIADGLRAGDASGQPAVMADGPRAEGAGDAGASGAHGAADVVRPEENIPRLRSQLDDPDSLDPASYARTTCFTAGHLVTKNAGWRSQRPVVDEGACTGCAQCVQYCPDGAIYFGCAEATAEAAAAAASHDASSCGSKPSSRAEARVLGLSPQSEASCEPSLAEPMRQIAIVDADFCKGCGICATLCRFGAIAMVGEAQALAAERSGSEVAA